MKKLLFVLALMNISILANAGTVHQCDNMTITRITVQGDRVDDFVMENKLLILFESECQGHRYVYVNQNNPAYNSFLSVVLSAQAQRKKVGININGGAVVDGANELATIWISSN